MAAALARSLSSRSVTADGVRRHRQLAMRPLPNHHRRVGRIAQAILTHPFQGVLISVLTTMDEASLIASAQRGDERAFETLLAQYSLLINKLCEPYFLPGSDRADLLQEARLGFFKGVRDFKPEGSPFRSFAELAVRRNIITALKYSTRQKHQTLNRALSLDAPLNNDEAVTRTLVDVHSLAPETERDEQLTQVVRDALVDGSCLSDFEAHVFLAYLNGATYIVMARNLGKSVKAVDNAMQRVRRKTDHALREAVSAHLVSTRKAYVA